MAACPGPKTDSPLVGGAALAEPAAQRTPVEARPRGRSPLSGLDIHFGVALRVVDDADGEIGGAGEALLPEPGSP